MAKFNMGGWKELFVIVAHFLPKFSQRLGWRKQAPLLHPLHYFELITFVVPMSFRVQWVHESLQGMYQYFVKVVPTIYTNIRGHTIQSNQFSVTEHFKSPEIGRRSLPGVFFFYDLSPIKVTFKEEHASFLHFMTNICEIIGGIFT